MEKQKQKILFIELKVGALMSEMAQKPKGRQCVDKKARHFAKVKVDKTTKPSWMNCNYIHRTGGLWCETTRKRNDCGCKCCSVIDVTQSYFLKVWFLMGCMNLDDITRCSLGWYTVNGLSYIYEGGPVLRKLFNCCFHAPVLQRQVSARRLTWMFWIQQFLKT